MAVSIRDKNLLFAVPLLFLHETRGDDVSKVAKLFVFYEWLILPQGGDLFVSPMHDRQSVVHMNGGDCVIPELGKEITQDEVTALGIW